MKFPSNMHSLHTHIPMALRKVTIQYQVTIQYNY